MRLPNDKTRYSNNWKYVEVAAYGWNPTDGKYAVMREGTGKKGERKAKFYEWDNIEAYADKNDRVGVYTSIFRYDKPSIDGTILGNLYFDFDSTDIELAQDDMLKVRSFFVDLCGEEAVRTYFTGAKGFHIEIEALALGVSPTNNLASTYRVIANDMKETLNLSTIDFSVYDKRRMWRLANTKHQSTGLYKVPLINKMYDASVEEIKEFAKTPQHEDVREQTFNLKANEWYREYVYKIEASKKPSFSAQDLINRFNRNGTASLKKLDESTRQFNPKDLLENCHAITDLWEKAETKHHLDHEERLFLLSILSYTDESLFYLHEILKNCNDYNFEKSTAHINDWIKRREMGIGGRPYTCRRANEAGVGCGDCSLEGKKKWAQVGDSWVETDETAEPSPVRFGYTYGNNTRKRNNE